MRKVFIMSLFASSLSFLTAAQVSPSNLEGSLANGKFLVNKKEISKDWKMQTAITALGNASRINDGSPSNKVHIYDKNGIVLYEQKKNGKLTGAISEVSIYFSIKEANEIVPNNFYPGSLKIENVRLTKESKPEDVMKNLEVSGYKKKGNFWYIKNNVYLIFRFSNNGLLETVSIGKSA
jgi:hypothetical protein